MTILDPRTPVIVGVGQVNHREHGAEPVDLMSRSAHAALSDTGATGFIERVDAVRVVWGVWPYADPGRLVAERIGAKRATTTMTALGGNQVYDLLIDTATRIQRGDLDVAVVCGAETLRTRRGDHAAGHTSEYLPERDNAAPDDIVGTDKPLSTETEAAMGLDVPTRFYAMAETAIRHRTGETIDAHRRRIAELWAGASAVAASNPDAWIRDALTAEQIATPSGSNRMINSPYPKLMTSNLNVDQAGAFVICSAEAAEAAGVARDRWIFPHAGVGASDHQFVTNRWAFDESPAIRLAGRRTLELAATTIDGCALLDLYSCFPAAVQVGHRELDVTTDRPFTITGGLTFAAGPLNCYCLLPLVRAVRLLREAPDQRAFLTGNGGYLSKHSMVVLAGAPAAAGFRTERVQDEVDALPARPTPTDAPTTTTLETYTVGFDRAGQPDQATLACLDDAGARHFARTRDADTLVALLDADQCGAAIHHEDDEPHLT